MSGKDWLLVVTQFIGPLVGVLIANALARKGRKLDDVDKTISETFKGVLKFQRSYIFWLQFPSVAGQGSVAESVLDMKAHIMMLEMLLGEQAASLKPLLNAAVSPLINGRVPQVADLGAIGQQFDAQSDAIIAEMRRVRASLKADSFDE